MRVLIRGPVDPWTGYGRDVIGLCEALLDLRVDVSLWPLSIAPGVPERVAALLRRPVDPPYDAVIWYCPPENIQPWSMWGWGTVQLGWTMWERLPFTGANLPWWEDDDPDLSRGYVWSQRYLNRDAPAKGWLDALIVTCRMNRDAFAHIEHHLPIEVIPPGVDADNYPYVTRPEPDGRAVRFGWSGVPSPRKNLPAMLDAWAKFRREHPDVDAELEVKTSGIGAGVLEALQLADVTVHRYTWSTKQLADWYSSLDCLISTSRGEGMNKPACEAMATGATVAAPLWGGHEHWLHPDTGYEIAHELVASPFEAGTQDCEVNVDDLASLLPQIAADHAGRRARGHAGARLVRSGLSWRRSAEALLRIASRHLADV